MVRSERRVLFLRSTLRTGSNAVAVSAYKIWATGPAVGIGATAPMHVGIAGIAKTNAPHATVVANELVCNQLATALLLPTPPGFLIQHGGAPYYVSLNFNLAGHNLPPADPAALVAAHPELAWGITLFDAWVLNDDRHAQNIAFDTATNHVQIFDHSHALFAKRAQMPANAAALGFGNQCLAPRLTTVAGLLKWHARFVALPEFFVRTVVENVAEPQFNVTAADAAFCADWLIDRRARLKDLVLANRGNFPAVSAAEWNVVAPPPPAVAAPALPPAGAPAAAAAQP
jgi:hypothetical protein